MSWMEERRRALMAASGGTKPADSNSFVNRTGNVTINDNVWTITFASGTSGIGFTIKFETAINLAAGDTLTIRFVKPGLPWSRITIDGFSRQEIGRSVTVTASSAINVSGLSFIPQDRSGAVFTSGVQVLVNGSIIIGNNFDYS